MHRPVCDSTIELGNGGERRGLRKHRVRLVSRFFDRAFNTLFKDDRGLQNFCLQIFSYPRESLYFENDRRTYNLKNYFIKIYKVIFPTLNSKKAMLFDFYHCNCLEKGNRNRRIEIYTHRKENLRNAVVSIFIQLVEISVRPPWPSLYLELHHLGRSYSKVGGKVGEKVRSRKRREREREGERKKSGGRQSVK